MLVEPTKSWMVAVDEALKTLHENFKNNPNSILTESDLKCWLFCKLQNVNKASFSVHTEVTHYAKHKNGNNEFEKEYKFRDLSLLTPSAILENEEFLKEGGERKDLFSKGFKHKAPAIHFELKFIRQGNNLRTLESDIKKLNSYHPDHETAERRFVVVWGSRNENAKVAELEEILKTSLKKFKNENLNGKLEFYLFDKEVMKCFRRNGSLELFEFKVLE